MKKKTILYVVTYTRGGYAREDAGVVCVAGVYTDKATADKVKRVVHGDVNEVELDEIAPGYIKAMEELGMNK